MDRQLHLLTGAYALNALDPAEREEFESAVVGSEDALHEVRSLSETAALLAGQTTPVAPPAHVKANIMAAIRQTPQLPADNPSGTPDVAAPMAPAAGVLDLGRERARRADRAGRMPRSTKFLAAAAATFLLAAGGLTGVVVNQNHQQEQLEQQVAALGAHQQQLQQLTAASDMKTATQQMDDGAEVTIAYSASAGLAALTAHDLPALPSDKGYELWLIGDQGATPMGMLDGTGTTLFEGSVASATHLGITVESAQGSKQPTSDPIMLQKL
ncbi:anti-sigma factor domain-containing protein [Arthrobacter sp.]|uniref:anti-sigma factor n=1 Tax=Arthrobacter sp. TaxID=1667 RepID=UPI003A92EE6C